MKRRPRLRRIAWLSAGAAVLVAATAIAVSAQPRPRHDPGMGPGPWGRPFGARPFAGRAREMRDHFLGVVEKLDLSDAQKEKLHEIRRRSPSVLMPKKQALIEARMDLHDLMAKSDADANQMRKAHEKLLRARDELQAAAFDLRLQMRELLTPEQREKLRKSLPRRERLGEGDPGWEDPGEESEF